MKKISPVFVAVLLAVSGYWVVALGGSEESSVTEAKQPAGTEVATFAGGCFWCVEADLEKVPGVVAAISGFSGGSEKDPSYKDVAYGRTTHLESVQIFYDPNKTSYAKLVDAFFRAIDPTDASGSFVDRGPHYRSAIFVHGAEQEKIARAAIKKIESLGIFDKKVATEVRPFDVFYPAEDYHQDFYKKSKARYSTYRSGSGRDAFIAKTWSDVPPLVGEGSGS